MLDDLLSAILQSCNSAMVDWDSMAVVGRIARPHGLKGQVIVNPETDFPEQRFQPGAELFVSRGGVVESLTLTTRQVSSRTAGRGAASASRTWTRAAARSRAWSSGYRSSGWRRCRKARSTGTI